MQHAVHGAQWKIPPEYEMKKKHATQHTPSILWITLFPPAFCPIRIYQYAILSYACMNHVQYHHCPFRFSALLKNVLCFSCASRTLSSTHWIPAIAVYGWSCCFSFRATMHSLDGFERFNFNATISWNYWNLILDISAPSCFVPCARNCTNSTANIA